MRTIFTPGYTALTNASGKRDKSRKYYNNTTGEIVSRRFAEQIGLGVTYEQRAKDRLKNQPDRHFAEPRRGQPGLNRTPEVANIRRNRHAVEEARKAVNRAIAKAKRTPKRVKNDMIKSINAKNIAGLRFLNETFYVGNYHMRDFCDMIENVLYSALDANNEIAKGQEKIFGFICYVEGFGEDRDGEYSPFVRALTMPETPNEIAITGSLSLTEGNIKGFSEILFSFIERVQNDRQSDYTNKADRVRLHFTLTGKYKG